MSSSILMILITIAVTFLVINLQTNDSKRLQNGSEKWNEQIEEDFEVLAEEELYIDIVATLEPTLESDLIESPIEIDDFDINLFIKGTSILATRGAKESSFKMKLITVFMWILLSTSKKIFSLIQFGIHHRVIFKNTDENIWDELKCSIINWKAKMKPLPFMNTKELFQKFHKLELSGRVFRSRIRSRTLV